MNDGAYCNLEPINKYFNNKPLYRCSHCGLTVGLENPDTKILCFKKMTEIANLIHNSHTEEKNNAVHIENQTMEDVVINNLSEQARSKEKIIREQSHHQENIDNLCSEQQIEDRLNICKTCEYFQNNSCLLCGCTVIREMNHKNKLAHKDQRCPANKWDIIKD